MIKAAVLLVAAGMFVTAAQAQEAQDAPAEPSAPQAEEAPAAPGAPAAISAEAITSAIDATAADESKVKAYCAMAKKLAEIGDDEQKAEAAGDEIDTYFKSLGPDFEAAWNSGQDAADGSPEAAAFDAAMTKLDDKCGG